MASLPKILCELDKLEPGILRNLYDNFLKNNEAALNAEDGDGHKITSETLQEWAQSDVLSDYGKAMAANSAYRMAYAIVDAIAVSISGGGYFPGYYNSGYFFKTYIPFPAPGQMQYQDPYVPEKGKVYVDMQDGSIYIWNDVSKIYFAIGGKSGGGGGTTIQLYSTWTLARPEEKVLALDAALGWDLYNNKVDKESGKGLSANDYSNAEKEKVAAAYADHHSHTNKSVLDTITSTPVAQEDVNDKGTTVLPIYFDGTEATPVTGIHVPGNVEAEGGVSAHGIADLSFSGGGGGSSVEVIADANLDTSEGAEENLTQVASAFAVARIKGLLNESDIPIFTNNTLYKRGELCRYLFGTTYRIYRFNERHSSSWDLSKVSRVDISELSKPLSIPSDIINNLT